jgi:hypothetical protein
VRAAPFAEAISHSNPLVPSLLRHKLTFEVEHNLYHEFFARAGAMVRRDATSRERLAFLQHHGIPTRLLDWTESIAVALFFALNGAPADPELWIVNAFHVNRGLNDERRSRIMLAGLDTIPDYHDCFVRVEGHQEWPFCKPMFLQIPWSSERLRAQSGFFTFHHDSTPLEKSHTKYVRRVAIPEDAIPGVRSFLRHAGVSEYTVFPDFVGLAAFMRQRYRI